MISTPHLTCRGFTLMELVLVLVALGLLMGGALIGADLMRASTIQSTLGELEKYNSAATLFRAKYAGLPGDLQAKKAIEAGFAIAGDDNSTGAIGLRDDNTLIQDGAGHATSLSGEVALFWKDLGAAALVRGDYSAIGSAVGPALAVSDANIHYYIPRTRLRDTASYLVYAPRERNYFLLASITAAITTGRITATPAVTPLEARDIDGKIDDGHPTSGLVRSYTDLTTMNSRTVDSATHCIGGSATHKSYNLSSSGGTNVNCMLQIKAAF
ncbi:MAG: prepilin-type N-terminal cleavage/methylation domain-containing protein [Rickettsiales bacterium]